MKLSKTIVGALCLMALLLLTGCGIVPQSAMQIERGMTKLEVERMFGKPHLRRFNASQEEWEYRRYHASEGREVLIITFVNNRVDKLDNFREPASPVKPILPEDYPRAGGGIYGGVPYPQPTPRMDDGRWFEEFFARLQKEHFDDDRNLLIRAAAKSRYFTSAQVNRLLGLETFGDDRLKILEIVAKRVVDMENAYRIIGMFRFDSEKRRAAQLLGIDAKY